MSGAGLHPWIGKSRSVASPVVAASVLLLALVLVGLGLFRYVSLRSALLSSNARTLDDTYRTLLSELNPAWSTPVGLASGGPSLAYALSSPTVGVLVVNAQGEVVGAAPTRRGHLLPPRMPLRLYARAVAGAPIPPYAIGGSGAHQQLVVLERVGTAYGPTGVVELATPLQAMSAILASEVTFDLVGGAVAIAAAALAASWMIRRQLKPLALITAASERVASGDLEGRVDLVQREDEIGRLARSFDEMVDRLAEAFARERAAQSHLTGFLAEASHALRTPLTVLAGHLDLLLAGAADEPSKRQAAYRRMRSESERMSRLVSGLLALGRLEGAGPVVRVPVDLAGFLQALAPDLEVLAGDRLQVVAGSVWALADPHSLRDAVLSLVDNAVRYAGPDVPIRVESGVRNGSPVLEVADGGPGLAPEERERVFERFVRGRAGLGRSGAGLGLALVRRSLAAMGATIEADAAVEGGASFVLRFVAPGGE